jgi:hypothetical protein
VFCDAYFSNASVGDHRYTAYGSFLKTRLTRKSAHRVESHITSLFSSYSRISVLTGHGAHLLQIEPVTVKLISLQTPTRWPIGAVNFYFVKSPLDLGAHGNLLVMSSSKLNRDFGKHLSAYMKSCPRGLSLPPHDCEDFIYVIMFRCRG